MYVKHLNQAKCKFLFELDIVSVTYSTTKRTLIYKNENFHWNIFSEFYVQGSTATPGTQEPPPSETMPKSASFKKKIR